jgi:hypothetical protein
LHGKFQHDSFFYVCMYANDIMKYLADEGFSAESGDESSAVSVASFHPPTDKNEFLFKCTELVKLIESGLELFRTVDNRFEIINL